MKKAIGTNDLLSIPEAAKILKKDRTTVWRWVKQGKLDSMQLGGIVLIPRPALGKFKEEQ